MKTSSLPLGSGALVLRPGKRPVTVRNLGWLIRKGSAVASLGFNYYPEKTCDGEFVARLTDGTTYITKYASIAVCWMFVRRPSWLTLPFQIVAGPLESNRFTVLVGDAEFKRIAAMEWSEMKAAILTKTAL